MEELAIVGVAMTKFGNHPNRSTEALAHEAVLDALGDAGVAPNEIDASFVGNVQLSAGTGQRMLKDIGLVGPPVVNVESAGASSTTALNEGAMWIRAGMAETVLALGVESLSRNDADGTDLDGPVEGIRRAQAAVAARSAQARMQEGLTLEQLALVAVKNRTHATANPYAHLRAPITVEDVLASPEVAEPITALQCCTRSDGASAVVLTTVDRGRALAGGRAVVRLAGSALSSNSAGEDIDGSNLTMSTSIQAYERAGVGPEDAQVAEAYDAFTASEIVAYEALGFCEGGGGGRYVEMGKPTIGGSGVVVNPSGGLLSRGHALGATGAAQIAELAWQLRGEAGPRQVDRARVAVSHTVGGRVDEMESRVCVVHVLKV